MVGIVVTISPSFSLYKIVVLPAASKPTMRMRISFFPKIELIQRERLRPILKNYTRKRVVRMPNGVQVLLLMLKEEERKRRANYKGVNKWIN